MIATFPIFHKKEEMTLRKAGMAFLKVVFYLKVKKN